MRQFLFCMAVLLCVLTASSCDHSVYTGLADKNTVEARQEEGRAALDRRDYDSAIPILAGVWEEDKSATSAQLYAVALMGKAKIDLFSLVKAALINCETTSAQKKLCTKPKVLLNYLAKVLPTNIENDDVLTSLKNSVSILKQASEQNDVGPLMCFTGGLYVHLLLTSLREETTSLRDIALNGIPRMGEQCQSSSANETTKRLYSTLNHLGTISTNLSEMVTSVGECLKFTIQTSENETVDIQKALSQFVSRADTGCDLSGNVTVGGLVEVPQCLKASIQNAAPFSSRNDGKIDGCELFINCLSGSCF